MSCDKITQMHRLHDGEISPAERVTLEAHAAGCPECAQVLADLRGLRRLIGSARPAPLPPGMIDRLSARVPRCEDRAIFRIASGLTAAAAAILLAAVLSWPAETADGSAQPAIWQSLAVRPSLESSSGDSEMLVLAQWMADDLSSTHNGESR